MNVWKGKELFKKMAKAACSGYINPEVIIAHKSASIYLDIQEKAKEAVITCSAGLLKAGGTDEFAETPDPDNISLRMPLIPR